MRRRKFQIAPFLGLITSIDPRSIPASNASDLSNVRVEDGALRVRYGYRNRVAAHANYQGNVYGFEYLQGYNTTTGAEVEEFVSYEQILGVVRPMSINPTTGVKTEILDDGGAVVSLNANEWKAIPWQDVSYHINPNASTTAVYRHAIGDSTSWVAVAPPTAPSNLMWTISYGGPTAPYSDLNFTGVNTATNVTYTNPATSANTTNGGTTWTQGHAANAHTVNGGNAAFQIDLSASSGGIRNFVNNDIFGIDVTHGAVMQIDWSTCNLQFINNDGSPVTITGAATRFTSIAMGSVRQTCVRFDFSAVKDRADWDNIRYIKLSYRILASSATASSNNVSFRVTIGGIWVTNNLFNDVFAATYYDSTTQRESGQSPHLVIPNTQLYGMMMPLNTGQPAADGLGVHLDIEVPQTSQSGVDFVRLYRVHTTGAVTRYYRVNETAEVTGVATTVQHRQTFAEDLLETTYTLGAGGFTNVQCATPFKGWVVWGYKGGVTNVKHSRIGEPELLANPNDDLENDDNRGATFTLADDADEPQSMHGAGDVLIILGKRGVYAQVGDRPSNMSPPKKLPMSKGVANRFASCRYRDENGNYGVAFLDAAGEVYLALVDHTFNEQGGYKIVELSQDIRGTLKSFLADAQSLTSFATARVFTNEADSSLWVVMGSRAAVLRRANLLDGKRYWELYNYTTGGTIKYVAASTKWRIHWFRSGGQIDEVEYNSSTAAYIEGTSRDGGSAMPASSIYWTSKVFANDNSRIDVVDVERDTLTNTPIVTLVSTRQTSSKTLASGKRRTRFGPLQQGTEHKVKIAMTEGDAPIRRIVVEGVGPLSRRATA